MFYTSTFSKKYWNLPEKKRINRWYWQISCLADNGNDDDGNDDGDFGDDNDDGGYGDDNNDGDYGDDNDDDSSNGDDC